MVGRARTRGNSLSFIWVDALEARRMLAGTTLRIDAGGAAYTDPAGKIWAADYDFSGGTATHTAYSVSGTTADFLYYNRRVGNFSYALPVAAGSYTLSLYFSEPTMTAKNQRKFNVFAQGKEVLTNFDIYATAGAKSSLIKTFSISVTGAQLNLTFQSVINSAILSAIQLVPVVTVPPPPPQPPAPPGAVAATPVSPTAVQLTWSESSSSSVSSFLIERADPVDDIFTQIGSAIGTARQYADNTVSPDSQYIYEIQASGGGGVSPVSLQATASTLSPMPAPWLDTDIGSVGIAGGAATDGTAFDVVASGSDTYTSADAFHFVYQPVSGDVTIIAEVTAQQSTDPWARAGVTIRQSLTASAPMADMFVSPGNGAVFQSRVSSTVAAASLALLPASAPVWVELVRNENTIAGYFSTDDETWTPAGSQTFPPAATVYVGLCVSAHNNTLLNTSTFDNVSVATSTPFQWIAGATAPLNLFESSNAVVGDNFYIFGGFYDVALDATTQSDVYNVDTNTWSPIAPMPIAVTHAGTAVVGTDVYLAGGFVGKWPSAVTNQFMMYDTVANTWTVLAPLPAARGAGGLVLLGDQLHFFGGINSTKTTDEGDQWIYDLDNPTAGWTPAAPMPNPRNHFGYVALDGLAYAIGGEHLLDEDHSDQTEVDVYDPVGDAWTTVAPLPFGRSHNHTSTFTYDDQIVLITGQENGQPKAQTVADTMAYNPATNVWTMLPAPAPAVREAAAAKVIGNLVIVTGGADQNHVPQSSTWIGDISSILTLPAGPVNPAPIFPLPQPPEIAQDNTSLATPQTAQLIDAFDQDDLRRKHNLAADLPLLN